MDLLRLGDEKLTRNVSRRDIGAVSLTDGKSRKVALEAQEKQLRIACEVESTRGQKHRAALRSNYPLDHSMV